MASSACTIGSSLFFEFRDHDCGDQFESLAHFCDFIGQVVKVLIETSALSGQIVNGVLENIDFSLKLCKIIDNNVVAVVLSFAPKVPAAFARAHAIFVEKASVRAKFVR